MTDENKKVTGEGEDLEVTEISDGFIGVLQLLASKFSKKAAVIGFSMLLIYLLSATPAAPKLVFSVCILAGLGIFYSTLQWILDKRQQKARLKIIANRKDKNKPDKTTVVTPEEKPVTTPEEPTT